MDEQTNQCNPDMARHAKNGLVMNVEEMAGRFKKLYSGVVCDAMDHNFGIDVTQCILPGSVRRITGDPVPIAGPAMTCKFEGDTKNERDDGTIRLDMLDAMTPGCVQVMDAECSSKVACFGDISALLAISRGCVGLVTDGVIRDAALINTTGFQVFGAGTLMRDALGWAHIAAYGHPVSMRTFSGEYTTVSTGQWIFADGDGVILIPAGLEERVLVVAEVKAATEDNIRQAVRNGEPPKAIYERLGSW